MSSRLGLEGGLTVPYLKRLAFYNGSLTWVDFLERSKERKMGHEIWNVDCQEDSVHRLENGKNLVDHLGDIAVDLRVITIRIRNK